MTREIPRNALSNLSALADPVRRRLYGYVAACDQPVRRDEVAQQTGVGRSLVAYHLDQLVEAGLLTASFARPPGRGGPGAGRPAKHYERVFDEVSVSLPPRNYGLLARILADAIAADPDAVVGPALEAAARHEGRLLGESGLGLVEALTQAGFEPITAPDGEVELRNCPFGTLSQEHTALICGLNLEFVQGLLLGRAEDPQRARLSPRPMRCCVVIDPGGVAAEGRAALEAGTPHSDGFPEAG